MNQLELDTQESCVVGAVLRQQAEEIPDATFLMDGDEHYSFGRVNELANSYATGLRELGVEAGDNVAIFMGSSPECIFTTLGVNKLGAIWVPTNNDYRGEWLHGSLVDCDARILVVDAALLPRVAELGPDLPFEHIVVRGATEQKVGEIPLTDISGFSDLGKDEPDAEVAYRDTAAVLWTSGTTGRPKGVMQSHSAWLRGSQSAVKNFQMHDGDVLYNCLPMCNSGAWISTIYPALLAGLPLGLDDRFSAGSYWDRTRFYGATHSFTLGAMHIFLWQAPERPDDKDNPVRVASAIPMPDQLMEPFKERFGIDVIVQGYGQSEAFTLLTRVDDGTRKWKLNSAGVPSPGFEVKLLDDDDQEVPVGEVGEFCTRTERPYTLYNGYYKNPEATLESFRNLWYHTGDLGRMDEDGEFYFFDRKADYIRYKGRNVSSFAVEATVTAHPAVSGCAAYGVRSDQLESESEIKVEVVLMPDQQLEPEDLATFVNENAPYFFVPRYIEFVDEIPRTPSGRARKFQLRDRGVTEATWDREATDFTLKR
ncbi:MAG: AMP-binding protein [Deltaproteobacteria bacterium]|nr:AMP-binding protein [Deltaproteobacteria bacterium]